MNFKDLQFSIGKLKADVHSQIVKNNPLQKQDTKALSMWIFQERNDLAAMRTMAYKRSETIKALKDWVKEEVAEETIENSRDLEDLVGDKLCRLLDKQVEIEQEFAGKYQQYRHAIKSIREREGKLADEREKKRTLQSRIANLQKSSPKSPKLLEFQNELRSLTQDTVESELDLADFKRFALKEAFYLRFNAMHEFAEKTALIAGFGKYLTDLIDTEPTIKPGQPRPHHMQRKAYDKGTEAAIIVADAMNAIGNWKPLAEDVRPTLANSSGANATSDSTSIISNDSSILDLNDPKGKLPALSQQQPQQKTPPALPPRRPTDDAIVYTPTTPTTSDHQENVPPPLPPKTAHVSPSVANNTGDLKTSHEVEIDLDKIDVYDAPPPAYEEQQKQEPSSQSSTCNNLSVPPQSPPNVPTHKEQYQPVNSSVNYDPPHSPEPTSAATNILGAPSSQHTRHDLTDSPLFYHQSVQQQQQRPTTMTTTSTSFHDPTTSSPYLSSSQQSNINYHQLYDHQYQYQQQQQQQQQHSSTYPYYRPYSEFQQQVHQQQQRPKVDAGGFRIPSSAATQHAFYISAEEEKEKLAEYYKQQDSYYAHQQSQHHHQQPSSSDNGGGGGRSGNFSSPVSNPHQYQHSKRYEQKIQENDD